ncbi:MAG: hypothetical protein ACKN87_04935 [Microcystis aeruginosa]
MTRNCHVPFCRAVGEATLLLTLILREEGMRILSTNTDGQSEFQAWGETVRLVGTCTEKRVSVNQESPVTASA